MTPQPSVSMESLVVGRSARMRAVFDFLRIIGNSDSTVLITGESGTGKEVTATLIHQNSRRRHRPFVAVSCALFSETLIESELFGHERGAFTGAIKDRPGRFELAEGGTIFLDDIDDVPLPMQVKLLRVLQNRTVERVGGTRTIPVNVRVIAGTKRDLKQLVAEGKFREDLFYRLNVLPVSLPPLRERREDIPVLMEHFLRRFFRSRGEDVPAISDAVTQSFTRYSWPGNVRELENACERIAQTCSCGTVRVGCVAANILFRAGAETAGLAPVARASGVGDALAEAPRHDPARSAAPPSADPVALARADAVGKGAANAVGHLSTDKAGHDPTDTVGHGLTDMGGRALAYDVAPGHAVVDDGVVDDAVDDVGDALQGVPPLPSPRRSSTVTSISLDDRLREVEAGLIGWALQVSGGNKSKAAELLRIKRSTLGDRINRCGIGRAHG